MGLKKRIEKLEQHDRWWIEDMYEIKEQISLILEQMGLEYDKEPRLTKKRCNCKKK